MDIMLGRAALLAAALLVALIGYAGQHGATCLVAALDEVTRHRRATRLLALAEAALWVSGGLVVLRAAGLTMAMPTDHALTGGAALGGVLLGAGAMLAGACALGALARLGAGEWGFLALPIGYFAGCALGSASGLFAEPAALPTPSLLAAAPGWLALPLLLVAMARLAWLARHRSRRRSDPLWGPYGATIVIGVAFVFLHYFVGPWAFTDALKGLAMGRTGSVAVQALLLASLLAGAVFGAWHSRRLQWRTPTPVAAARMFAGGMVMAFGSLMIPGGNDALLLIGAPSLHGYALTALATMAATIAGLQLLAQRR
jgi:toxin CptA